MSDKGAPRETCRRSTRVSAGGPGPAAGAGRGGGGALHLLVFS